MAFPAAAAHSDDLFGDRPRGPAKIGIAEHACDCSFDRPSVRITSRASATAGRTAAARLAK